MSITYASALRRVATGIFTGPFSAQLWGGFPAAISEVTRPIGLFVVMLFIIATYPVSVFLVAWLAHYSERKSELANKSAHEEWMREMSES